MAIDISRVVTLDFETFYDQDYTLSKLSTSEYVRDPRFKAQMVGIKIGKGKTKIYPAGKIKAALQAIPWSVYALLCHNTAFDGLILWERYGIKPCYYLDTLSMARGLHSNEIGAGLAEVAPFYGKGDKIQGVLENTKGLLDWPKEVIQNVGVYCAQDVDLTFEIFQEMLKVYPQKELDLINLTCRMFCQPSLRIDAPRVQAEYDKEVAERSRIMLETIDTSAEEYQSLLKGKDKALIGTERELLIAKKVLGSNERFADLLRAEGVEPPVKLSPAWMKKSQAERTDEGKWIYAFGKDDLEFTGLPENIDVLGAGLDLNKKADVAKLAAKQERIQQLVDARLAVKSTVDITRAERFLKAAENGGLLPAGYAYYRAKTGRFGGTNKINLQNLPRGGELRKSILAAPGHVLCVCDSGQIEVRVNAWLWDQTQLLDAFRAGRDVYCDFGRDIYGREITRDDKDERHVAKTAVLGLGYGMGAAKFQLALARGAGGRKVVLSIDEAKRVVNVYRRINAKIVKGWQFCETIITDMATGRAGSYKCLHWEKERIWLPNGMCLKYPDLRFKPGEGFGGEWTYQDKNSRVKIYPSKLDENLVQALARIIVMDQMLEIDKKYPVVMTTHDEVVAMPRLRAADACQRYMGQCMATPSPWCADIPLSFEGGYAENYSK